jgi:hypothetical protein
MLPPARSYDTQVARAGSPELVITPMIPAARPPHNGVLPIPTPHTFPIPGRRALRLKKGQRQKRAATPQRPPDRRKSARKATWAPVRG